MLGHKVIFCIFSTYFNKQTIKTISKYQVKVLQWKPLNTSSVNATNRLLHPNCLARNFPILSHYKNPG